jgi:hypothetical protein
MKKIKILLSITLFFNILNVKAQHSPLDFEKKILSYETISDSIVKEVYTKSKEGLFITWATIRYVIQKTDDNSSKIAYIDSLQKIEYWGNEMKINLLNERLYYLINSDKLKREIDSLYISITLANKKLLSDNYYSNLVLYAKWNLQLGKSYYKTFLEFEKADKYFTEVQKVFFYEINDEYTYKTLMASHESALRGRLDCARGSVFRLKRIVIQPTFHSVVWPIYKSYMEELGEKVEQPKFKSTIDSNIIIKKN